MRVILGLTQLCICDNFLPIFVRLRIMIQHVMLYQIDEGSDGHRVWPYPWSDSDQGPDSLTLGGHPYMTSALRGEGGLAQKKM